MAEVKLTKNQYIPFLDVLKGATPESPSWKRIDKSTVFALTMGEQETDVDYIAFENPVTEITSNKPELPQEIALYEGNPMYDFMVQHFYEMPIGAATTVPFLICFGGTAKLAWQGDATITSKVLDTVAGKITFSLKMGGDIKKGTYAITSGVPVFTEGAPSSASAISNSPSTKDKPVASLL